MYNAYVPKGGLAVTPSDTAELAGPVIATQLYIGGAGDVAVTTEDGSTFTYKAVPVGTTLWMRTRKVMATGTTATYIVAIY